MKNSKSMDTPRFDDFGVCMACQLAKLQESGGIITVAIESGHSQCYHQGCKCGCAFSTFDQCPDCRRYSTDAELNRTDGRCVDKKGCSETIVEWKRSLAAVRASQAAKDPKRARRRAAASRECGCGCGESTSGGVYRAGHNARHVASLVRQVTDNEITIDEAHQILSHSTPLVEKFDRAIDTVQRPRKEKV